MRAPARRRLATMVYEVILFGIVFMAGYLFSTLTQQRNGLAHHSLLMTWIGLVLAAYFVWFWTHGGQTLPMKTWRLKVVDARGAPSSRPGRCCATCSRVVPAAARCIPSSPSPCRRSSCCILGDPRRLVARSGAAVPA